MAARVVTRTALQQRLNGLLAVARQLAPSATVEVYAPQCSWLAPVPNVLPAERHQLEWLAAQVMTTGEVICIDDVQELPRSKRLNSPDSARQGQALLRFFAGFPMGESRSPLGALVVMTRTPYGLTPDQQQAIATLAAEIGYLIASVTFDDRDRPHPAPVAAYRKGSSSPTSPDYHSVMRLSMALQSCLTFEDLTNQLLALMPANLPISAFELALNVENHNSQQLCFWSDAPIHIPSEDELPCQIPDRFDLHSSESLPGSLLAQQPEPTSHRQGPKPLPPSRWRCYQLTAKKRHLGTLKLYLTADAAERFPVKNSFLDYVADQIGVTLRRLVLLRKLQTENLQDPLTKLFNRRHMMSVLSKLLKRVSYGYYQVGLIMLDLDHFKHLNDTYGHDVGDQVLSMVGLFLKGHARPNDVVCRFGGEEFVLILPGVTWPILERRARQLCRGLHYLNLTIRDMQLQITISAGFAIAPIHAQTPAALLKAADTALYEAKCLGRDRAVGAPLPPKSAAES